MIRKDESGDTFTKYTFPLHFSVSVKKGLNLLQFLLLHGAENYITVSFASYEEKIGYLNVLVSRGWPIAYVHDVSTRELPYFQQNIQKSTHITKHENVMTVRVVQRKASEIRDLMLDMESLIQTRLALQQSNQPQRRRTPYSHYVFSMNMC